MSIDLRPSWLDPELETWRDTVVRFVETEMAPRDAEARARARRP